jgi:predicted Zn-dependent protease
MRFRLYLPAVLGLSKFRFRFVHLSLIAILMGLVVIGLGRSVSSQTLPGNDLGNPAGGAYIRLPPSQSHPLPATLSGVRTATIDDYFDQVQISPQVGHLIWSRFPIKVYIHPPELPFPDSGRFTSQQLQIWQQAAQQSVREWQPYLPLQLVRQPNGADITMRPAPVPGQSSGRVRAGQTSYTFYLDTDKTLRHQMVVMVRPNQTAPYVLATLRHELGHALGIWGHSPQASDVLYFAQVGQSPPISARDINTLRRIYQQPTRVGWPVQVATR